MTIDSSQPLPDSQPENTPAVPSNPNDVPPMVLPVDNPAPLASPKKSRKTLWIILGVVLGLLGCCCLVIIIAGGFGAVSSAKERGPIESVLDDYMKTMEAKNAEGAYAFFSERTQRQVPISKVQEMFDGNNYVLFEGYKSLEITSLRMSAGVNANPDMPQGIVATVSGTINYNGGIQGSFNGTLEKVNDEWQIDGISVTVPPSKFK